MTQRQTEFEEEKVRLEFDNQTLREILQQKDESAGDAGVEIQELRAQLEVQRQNVPCALFLFGNFVVRKTD